jgi:hypothetical protein
MGILSYGRESRFRRQHISTILPGRQGVRARTPPANRLTPDRRHSLSHKVLKKRFVILADIFVRQYEHLVRARLEKPFCQGHVIRVEGIGGWVGAK